MSKSTITRERLEELASGQSGFNLRIASHEESQELALMALAGMDSEPVAEVVSIYGDPEAFGEREIRPLVGIQQMPYGTKLYRHAQQPVVPDEITSASAPEVFEIAAEAERLGLRGTYASYAVGWNACRAAMLQAGNSPVIPDGYVMVPVEQNGDMLAAAQDAYGETDGDIASTLRAAMLNGGKP